MSRTSTEARRFAVASLAALASLGVAASTAQAAFEKTLTYSCEYPLIESHPIKVDITAEIPAEWPAKTTTPAFDISVVATTDVGTYQGMKLIQASSVEGESLALSTVKLPGGFDLEVAVPITVDKYTLPATEQEMVLTASGQTPPLSFPTPGDATITVDQISLNLIAKKADGTVKRLPPVNEDSDGNPDTFDVACVLDPATQDTTLANFKILPKNTAPTVPGTPSVSGVTSSGASVSWAASTDAEGDAVTYTVLDGGTEVASGLTGTSYTFTGLAPETSHSITVIASDGKASSAASTATAFDTLAEVVENQPPSKPGTPTASNVTETSATVSWAASTDDNAVTGYTVSVGGQTIEVDGATTSTPVTGLTAGTDYSVTVTAKDADGASTASDAGSFTTKDEVVVVNEPPTAPGTPEASDVTATSAKISWAAATDDKAVTGYTVKVGGKTVDVAGNVTSATVSGLMPLTSYAVTVTAKDAEGETATSAEGNFKTLEAPATDKAPKISSVRGVGFQYIGGIATISGANFNRVRSVTFGGRGAYFIVIGRTIIALAPPLNTGTYPVVVTTADGASNEKSFTYRKLFW